MDSNLEDVVGIHSITVSNTTQFDSIQVTYLLANNSLYAAPKYGVDYGRPALTIKFGPLEYLEKIEGRTDGLWVSELSFITRGPDQQRKIYGPFGNYAPIPFAFDGYIFAFHGFYSSLIYRIGVYTLQPIKKSVEYGGQEGDTFDEHTDLQNPPIMGVSKIIVGHSEGINSIQAEYLLLGSVPVQGEKHGGDGGETTTITFDKGEVITGLDGSVKDGMISQLTLYTTKVGGVPVRYGPFGEASQLPFSISGNILGFSGSAGEYLNKIGVYYI
jgi:hypothetical protein